MFIMDNCNPKTASEDAVKAIPAKARLFIGTCAVIALGISFFLTLHGHDDQPNIPGCSDTLGCSTVVESQWAHIGFLPIAWLGAGGYMTLILGMIACARCPSQNFREIFWRIITMAAIIGIGFIIWLTLFRHSLSGTSVFSVCRHTRRGPSHLSAY